MFSRIIISGPPRSGKSTLISKLIEHYKKKQFTISGFLTPEVREKNKRVGFDLKNINTGKRYKLARIGDYHTNYRLGKYHVFTKDLDILISKLEDLYLKNIDLMIIDEIGKMELFSKKFQDFIKYIFNSDFNIIATIGQKLQHPIKTYILNLPSIIAIIINIENQRQVFNKIISIIR